MVHLQHFRELGQRLGGADAPRRFLRAHQDEGQQAALHLSRVEAGAVLRDDAAILELPDAFQHPRRHHAYLAGYLCVGDTGVDL